MIRLTQQNRQIILAQNEGFTAHTQNSQRNSYEERFYKIEGGKLIIRAVGKTSWADSRYDDTWVADNEETHRFLYNYLRCLNTDGCKET